MPKPTRQTAYQTDTMKGKKSSRTLQVHFTLLPSMLPGGNLTPMLYSVFRGVAVYRTLDPAPSASFVSLSALSIVLELPVLHLLSRFHLQPAVDYDLTLGGIAPWRDIWVTYAVARRIVSKLGVGRAFGSGSDCDPAKGLLAANADAAVSWDDGGGGIAHNWVPPSRVVPMSSYSLATLSENGFSHIHLLANDRFVRTPLDTSTRQLLASRARLEEDWIGLGRRRKAFGDVVELSAIAWQSYLQNPSVPPKIGTAPRVREAPANVASIITSLATSLPEAISGMETCLTFSPDTLDIHEFLSTNPALSVWQATRQLLQSITDALSAVRVLQSLLGTPAQRLNQRVQSKLQAVARAQLGLAEAMGWALVAAWIADTGELVEEAVDPEAMHGSDAGPQQDSVLEQQRTTRSNFDMSRRLPVAARYSRPIDVDTVPDVQLLSEQDSIWVWGSVIAVVLFFLCSGVSRYV